VLLVSGTMNPPHQGHVRLGLRAAEALRAEGHTVSAVCFVPVHNNYMHNKAAAQGSGPLFYPMERRCAMLQALVTAEGAAAADLCHVIDHEGEHSEELLEESPGYWAPKLPGGYLRTVPTVRLIHHFARTSPHLQAAGVRLGIVFGADNLAGMASWNRPGELLERCDLVLLARGTEAVCFGRDPHELLAALACLHVSAALPVVYGGETIFGTTLGSFTNANATPSALASGSVAPQRDHYQPSATRRALTLDPALGLGRDRGSSRASQDSCAASLALPPSQEAYTLRHLWHWHCPWP